MPPLTAKTPWQYDALPPMRNSPAIRLLVAGLLLVPVAVGCGPRIVSPPRPVVIPPGPRTLAILPFSNTTLSVDGPQVLRERLAREAARHGYLVQPVRETDDLLRGIGITLGGQLPGVKLAELHDALGTDAAIGGTLLKHQNVVLGVVNTQTLEAEMMLLDLQEGNVRYTAKRKISDQQNYAQGAHGGNGHADAAVCLISGLCGILGGISRNDMKVENEKLSQILCARMPPPGLGYNSQIVQRPRNASGSRTAATAVATPGAGTRPLAAPIPSGTPEPGTFPVNAPSESDTTPAPSPAP